jgi:ATP-binding cassette, subfamily B, bacterial
MPGNSANSFRPYAAARTRWSGSARIRAIRLLYEVSPATAVALGFFTLACGILPVLALVSFGFATGRIPGALAHGLGSHAGRDLLVSLSIGVAAYMLSLMRTPAEALLGACSSAVMRAGLQSKLARAVSAPAGIEHLEDQALLDQLAVASGELSSDGPADAPMTLAVTLGSRLSGLIACMVLATFRWWVGLLFLAGWTFLRLPVSRLWAERARFIQRATPTLRHSWYYLNSVSDPELAKEMRLFGLGDWVLGRYRAKWAAGMARPWETLGRYNRRMAALGGLILVMYGAGGGALGLAAYRHQIGLTTLVVMLSMLILSGQVGGVGAEDIALEQMLADVPDLDDIVSSLTGSAGGGGGGLLATGLPAAQIRLESVSYRYRQIDRAVLDGLDLELPAGQSLGLVGLNGAGKTTLITLLAGLRTATAGRILVDGTDLADLDARSWQRQVAVVYQDFTRYPLTARENVGLCDIGAGVDGAAVELAAEQAGADSVVAGLERGWESICSPAYRGGADMSGGQWQRIALARSLYAVARGARVLVLDEPTAQLDVRAEAAFYDRFLELTAGVTTVIISHRFASVRRADRIAVLEGGRITEIGSHEELLAAGGAYARMFALQASRFTENSSAEDPGDA